MHQRDTYPRLGFLAVGKGRLTPEIGPEFRKLVSDLVGANSVCQYEFPLVSPYLDRFTGLKAELSAH
jgi:hypothetical protein